MQTLDRPLDEDDRALADLAEVPDWTKVAGPDDERTGPEMVRDLVRRVSAATGWSPWALDPGEVIDDTLDSWGFVTRRGTNIVAFDGLVYADCRNSGFAMYDIGPDDIAAAEAGLDAHWPAAVELTRRHWGEPAYVGTDSNPGFTDEWRPESGLGRRHLAVWTRPGAELHLYSARPVRDPLTTEVGISYAVFID